MVCGRRRQGSCAKDWSRCDKMVRETSAVAISRAKTSRDDEDATKGGRLWLGAYKCWWRLEVLLARLAGHTGDAGFDECSQVERTSWLQHH